MHVEFRSKSSALELLSFNFELAEVNTCCHLSVPTAAVDLLTCLWRVGGRIVQVQPDGFRVPTVVQPTPRLFLIHFGVCDQGNKKECFSSTAFLVNVTCFFLARNEVFPGF